VIIFLAQVRIFWHRYDFFGDLAKTK
jgi:hypothetical protein